MSRTKALKKKAETIPFDHETIIRTLNVCIIVTWFDT